MVTASSTAAAMTQTGVSAHAVAEEQQQGAAR